MNPRRTELTPDNVKAFALQTFTNLQGAMVSCMIFLGDALGLYRAMRDAGPMTSAELAEKTALDERWVREWLRGQAAADLLEYDGERFELSPVAAMVLVEEKSPAFACGGFDQIPSLAETLRKLPEAFRTGRGLAYDEGGEEFARGVERVLAPWFRTMLVPVAVPAIEGLADRLERGAEVADVGCGAGLALIELARAFPNSRYHGYELSRHAVARARENARKAEVEGRVTCHEIRGEALPTDGRFDFVTTFDCLHDMTRPEEVMKAIRQALRDDGIWLIADIKAKPTLAENIEKNPLCAMMYGFSVMTCMSSALSEPDGAGLGTLGLPEPLVREMAARAGFSTVRTHDFQNPVNAYYEVRP